MRNVLLIVLCSLTLASCRVKNDYKEYIPVLALGDNLIEIRDSLTKRHKKNIQHVFKYYDVDFEIKSNRIYYKGDIDKELMWNFTAKANDTAWINAH